MPFPSNPTPGQTHTEDNTTWVYAGPANGWYRQNVGTNNSTLYNTKAPSSENSINSSASSPALKFTGTWFTGGTATTTKPQVLIEPTGTTSTAWSTSGTGLGVNAASGFAGNLLDLQVNGTSRFRAGQVGNITLANGSATYSTANPFITLTNANNKTALIYPGFTDGALGFAVDGQVKFFIGGGASSGLEIPSGNAIQWVNPGTQGFSAFVQDTTSPQAVAQRNGTNAQTFRVYNTYTSSTNYELGKLEWSSNVFRIGTEKGSGGGTARTVEVHTDSVSRLALDTTGSVRVVTGLTVATLPGTPTVGMIARVTDASAPAVGSIVAGGGAAAALVWYNGTNWRVIGV